MKRFNLSVAAVLAMSTFAIAGGDIEPVMEPVVETPVVVAPIVDDSGFYIGLGAGEVQFDDTDHTHDKGKWTTVTTLAGYQFNRNVALEGRYVFGTGDADWGGLGELDQDLDNIALYVKPMLPLGNFGLYALLGYGQTTYDNGTEYTESGFQWGLGVNYNFANNLSAFLDYTAMHYDDDGFDDYTEGYNVRVDGWTFGLAYKF